MTRAARMTNKIGHHIMSSNVSMVWPLVLKLYYLLKYFFFIDLLYYRFTASCLGLTSPHFIHICVNACYLYMNVHDLCMTAHTPYNMSFWTLIEISVLNVQNKSVWTLSSSLWASMVLPYWMFEHSFDCMWTLMIWATHTIEHSFTLVWVLMKPAHWSPERSFRF